MINIFKRYEISIRLFLLSFLILYFELALIRFIGAEVLYLGYFSNFVLISVFFGIGMGFLIADKKINLFQYVPQSILFLVAFVTVTQIDVTFLRENIGQLFFGNNESALLKFPLWFCLGLIFLLISFIFTGIAQEAARCFGAFRPIIAYSIDIGGSLAGILIFSVHSYSCTPPIIWFLLSFLILAVLSYRYSLINPIILGLGVLLLIYSAEPDHLVKWSPYQRIDVWPMKAQNSKVGYYVAANRIGHQTMQPFGTKEPIYDYAYTDIVEKRGGKGYDDVLIIGSGSGSDVSYALHYGVKRIDAVEIDPIILEAGCRLHPEQPYSDKRVKVYVNDGRAFMERATQKYDLIIYALPDSLASLSNFSNIRLESFLFTRQSFSQAKSLLKDDGVLVLYNYYRKKWLLEKISDMLTEVFGHPPAFKIYSDRDNNMLAAIAAGPKISGIASNHPPIVSATDNWPFLYMERPHLPSQYLWIILMFVGCAVFGVLASGHLTIRNMQFNGAFAFMGAAFLLLETKSVIQFFLLFGATWFVNSLVFFAVLVSVLIANLIVYKFDFKKPSILFALLFSSLVVQLLFPLDRLLGIEHLFIRYVVASSIFFSPIFFANLVFGFFFKDTPKAASAFGWNIIGTMIGGALEYFSIAIGYQSLTLLVIALYFICFLWTYWTLHGREVAVLP